MTRYRITVTRLDENANWQDRLKEWRGRRHNWPQNEPEPQRFSESSALTFEADETVFNAIRKAALVSMP